MRSNFTQESEFFKLSGRSRTPPRGHTGTHTPSVGAALWVSRRDTLSRGGASGYRYIKPTRRLRRFFGPFFSLMFRESQYVLRRTHTGTLVYFVQRARALLFILKQQDLLSVAARGGIITQYDLPGKLHRVLFG